MPVARWFGRSLALALLFAVVVSRTPAGVVHGQQPPGPPPVYQQIKAFALTGGSADVANFVLKRDRVEMTFTGTFYFAAAVEGHVTGAVFVGQGTVHAPAPDAPEFEKENVRRLLGADAVDSDFKTVVMRMTDDTFDVIDKERKAHPEAAPAVRTMGAAVSDAALHLAADLEPRLLKETGLNLSARLTLSIMNAEAPGVFFAQFDGGRRGRFSYVLDPQTRIPTSTFRINGGEKALFFTYQEAIEFSEVWMATYALEDYARGSVSASDVNSLVDVTHYDIDLDVRNPGVTLGLAARIDMTATASNVRAIPFRVGEELGTFQDARLKKQLRVKSARVGDQNVPFVQEDWEGGFTVFLPAALTAGDKQTLAVVLDGNFMNSDNILRELFFLSSNDTWLPRHGDLDRATFDLTFRHQKRHVVAASGLRISEVPDNDTMITKFKLDQPVPLVLFAVGAYLRTREMVSLEAGSAPIPIEFYNVNASQTVRQVQGDFIQAELANALKYYTAFFGKYPYPSFAAALHPYGFGQGFATLLMIAPADRADFNSFVFLSHETAHQWWGNIVAWRSYRDQWLSEGFAEYSAMRYTGRRDRPESAVELYRLAREALLKPPQTALGITSGRLADIGPLVLGLRLNTTKSFGAYQALIYEKGALVLRMLHFLLSNTSTAQLDDTEFVAMMHDFVDRHRDGSASTEEFLQVASEHFARTPLAQKYNLTNLNWFFKQWVYQTGLPTYAVDYDITAQPDGSFLMSGTIHQDKVPNEWIMPLPLVLTMGNNQQARTTIRASGPSTDFTLKLPAKPVKVELDPDKWVLSEKTTIKAR